MSHVSVKLGRNAAEQVPAWPAVRVRTWEAVWEVVDGDGHAASAHRDDHPASMRTSMRSSAGGW